MSLSYPLNRRQPEFDLSDRLRKARELTGLEKQAFADLVGIHRDSVANYEAGRRSPRRPVLVAWALACDVDLEWLIGDSVRPKGFEPPTFWFGVKRPVVELDAERGRRRPLALGPGVPA